jgi:hypothetical protein
MERRLRTGTVKNVVLLEILQDGRRALNAMHQGLKTQSFRKNLKEVLRSLLTGTAKNVGQREILQSGRRALNVTRQNQTIRN